MACCGASITLSCTFSNSRPVEGGTIAVRGSCSAVRRVCTRSVKQAAMAAGVGGSESSALLCSRAEPGHPGGCGQPWHKGCRQQKGPGFSLCVSLLSLSPLHLKAQPQTVTD